MLYSDEPVLSTIDAVYRASTDSTQWSAALGEMANLFGACAMTLLHRHSDGAGFVFAAANMDPHLMDLYDQCVLDNMAAIHNARKRYDRKHG